MNKQELIERLNNKLDETFAFQQSFKPLTWTHMECESKANAYMTAINYVEQLDEPQKVKVPDFVAEWYEMNKKNLEYRIWNYIQTWNDQGWNDFKNWMNKSSIKSLEILIKMQDGYEVEESKWVVNEGDLVIRKGEHEAKVYFVESVDDDGILLVNGIKDEFFTDLDERSVGEESINYFYENFRLLAKKENLEVEKV
ncbi:DUF1642 domain-containing protein [Enterococcus dongliensis]|uniref:DUF1642 domain-containing protein n=1 Tax=Enterococcus dongliensis TaxID=2559925 RepID=UPI00289283BA|nr:DUF1642 domain-containing protein [Enterococcus dongliensis]MDT2640441.1 DUF1642 domain-containing protein [Enterococcus dongliensis]